MKQLVWLGLSAGTTLLSSLLFTGLGARVAWGQPTAAVQTNLQLAVCLSDWDGALHQIDRLLASPDMPPKDRANLVVLSRQFQRYRLDRVVHPPTQACDPLLTGFGLSGFTPLQPLNLEAAMYASVGQGQPNVTSDQHTRRQQAVYAAGLHQIHATPIPALSPAQRLNTSNGSGVTAGAVSRGVNVYAFLAQAGDVVTLNVNVTRILPGLLYHDDDSQLFLFDSEGNLLADNDDFTRLQSRLSYISLPSTGVYYAAITTYNNNPLLNGDRQISGWQGLGGSSIEYTLTVTGLTPADQVGRLE